jgi:DNA-binding transcriptional regulator YdaS (Cro superfamily)
VRQPYARALARAAEIAGSIEALAVKLHISPPIVRAWINGTQEVPVPVFLTVVDLLMDKELAELRQSEPVARPSSDSSSDERKHRAN